MNPFNKRLKKAEPAAFVELYDLVGEKLFRYACSQLKSEADASDVVQEVFARLVKSHRSFAKAENINGYVFATARNEIIRWLKKKSRHSQTESLETGGSLDELADAGADKTPDGLDSKDWIDNTLARLHETDREIVQLKIFSQLTFEEIATAMQLKSSNVATRYRRAIAKLEQQLSTDVGESAGEKTGGATATKRFRIGD